MTETCEQFDMVRRYAEQLGEHFDTVQVFVTKHEGNDGTVHINYGAGNWFARAGQVHEWLIKSNERAKQYIRKEEEE